MANFEARTTCNRPRITDPEKVKEICAKYGGMEDSPKVEEIEGEDGTPEYHLFIFSYDWFQLWPFYKEGDGHTHETYEGEMNLDDEEATDRFLKEVQPYLAEDLVVLSIGAERLRFPLSAYSWIVPKGEGKVAETGLAWNMDEYERWKKELNNGGS